jgi:hypothetical protein
MLVKTNLRAVHGFGSPHPTCFAHGGSVLYRCVPSKQSVWHAPTTSQPRLRSWARTLVIRRLRLVAWLRSSASAVSHAGSVVGCVCAGGCWSVPTASFATSVLAHAASTASPRATRLAPIGSGRFQPTNNVSFASLRQKSQFALHSTRVLNQYERAHSHGFHSRMSRPRARMPDAHLRA